MKVDYLIIGAGFSGSVLAERLATQLNKKVLIVEKRNHIGGNCYDYYNHAGILVHKYGPHYFRTNLSHIFNYLSSFTDWHYLFYRVKVLVDGNLVPLPINLDTANALYGTNFSCEELAAFFEGQKTSVDKIENSEDVIISKVGRDLYERIYKPYTIKQWGLEPKDLDASVCARIPVRTNRDDRYFTDRYQAMPKYGYHKLFEKMLDHPNIHVLLQTDYKDIKNAFEAERLIYTGPIDEFFDHKHGRLPYRSLRFEHETLHQEFYQPVSQINYPHDYDFTRIVEIKHVTGQRCDKTTIVREFPMAEGEPYYPIPMPESKELYQEYKAEAEKMENVYFIGRLAQYKYFNMDQVIDEALKLFEELANEQKG